MGDSLAALPHGLLLALSPGETQPKAPNPTSAKNLLTARKAMTKPARFQVLQMTCPFLRDRFGDSTFSAEGGVNISMGVSGN